MKKYVGKIIIALFIVLFIAGCFIQAPITEAIGSLWSLLPPIIAIGLALITKEVYSSLFIGILTGGIVYAVATNGGFEGMFTTVIQDGLIANLADSYNVGILVFLVVLGVIVVLMNKAGGSRAYGEWAAAVSGTVEGVNGISLFISTIPYNLYALLTILMVIFLAVTGFDFGPMRTHELNARNGDLFTTRNKVYEEDAQPAHSRGKVIDLILPVAVLIVLCVLGMIYTGGFFSGTEFVEAFAGCDASYGLSLGSVAALVVIMIYFMCRRVLTFTECMDSVAAGFKQMVPAILILTFAWTLKTMTNHLEAGAFVSGIVKSATAISILLPVILFVVAVGLAFATGTSWGTFGILIPIVTSVFSTELANVAETGEIPQMVIVCISACLAGAVCGDHCSPISDTTIMASTGAQCDHVNHVSTQLPYALTVAGVCIVGYLISGFIQNVFVVLGISIVLMLGLMFLLRAVIGKKQN